MDQERRGVDLFIGRMGNSLCPMVAMLRYLELREMDDGPLFREQNEAPLTKDRLVAKVRQTLQLVRIDQSNYAGHSFCIGAATTAGLRVPVMQSSNCLEDGRATH